MYCFVLTERKQAVAPATTGQPPVTLKAEPQASQGTPHFITYNVHCSIKYECTSSRLCDRLFSKMSLEYYACAKGLGLGALVMHFLFCHSFAFLGSKLSCY